MTKFNVNEYFKSVPSYSDFVDEQDPSSGYGKILIDIVKIVKSKKFIGFQDLNLELENKSNREFKELIDFINQHLTKRKEENLSKKQIHYLGLLKSDSHVSVKQLRHFEIEGYIKIMGNETEGLVISLPKNVGVVQVPLGKDIVVKNSHYCLDDRPRLITIKFGKKQSRVKLPREPNEIVIKSPNYKIVDRKKRK